MSNVAESVRQALPAARRGDRQAFARLVAATQNTVSSIALSIVRDVQHSEDVAQEVYVRAWHKLAQLRDPDSFLPWLRQLTRNLARDHLRRQKARPGDAPDGDAEAEIARLAAVDRTGETAMVATIVDEHARALDAAFDELPAEAREVITLYYREGRSTDQVAELLGLRPTAVRQRLARARQRLKGEVERALAGTVLRSAPGAAFTAAVTTLLATASPPSAVAGVAAGLGAKSAFKLVSVAGLGMLFGLLGGIAGVVLGLRPHLKTAFDARERSELLAHRRNGVIAVVLAVAGFGVSVFVPGAWFPITVYAAFLGFIGFQSLVAIPRTLARRLAAERARDPAAAARHARQRRWGLFGLLCGSLCGLGGLLLGLASSGRLTLG